MGKIEEIKKAIEKAERLESKLTDECFQIGGYTSPKIRHLLNNLGAISESYLEIGVHRGSTFVASMYGNDMRAIAMDNWSEFGEDGTAKKDFIENRRKFTTKSLFLEMDCFQFNLNYAEPMLFDLYLYDGNHSYDAQKKAVTHFHKYMADEFILCIDDYQWEDVEKGTQDGIKEMGVEVLFEAELGMGRESDLSQYWNGFYVALLKKKT